MDDGKGLDFNELLNKFGQLRESLDEVNERLSKIPVVADAAGGLVKVTGDATGQIRRIEIDDSLLKEQDKSLLEDLIVAAVNKVIQMAKDVSQREMTSIAMQMYGKDVTDL